MDEQQNFELFCKLLEQTKILRQRVERLEKLESKIFMIIVLMLLVRLFF